MGMTRTAAIESVVTSVANRVALRIRFRFLFRKSPLTVVEAISLAVGIYPIPSKTELSTYLRLIPVRSL